MEFDEAIIRMNQMYKLPVSETPTLALVPDVPQRIKDFTATVADELTEGQEILEKLADGSSTDMDILVDLADWCGDLIVFAASEMAKYGIPLNLTLNCIMQSNFSKLGADGKPIYNSEGKFLKGPNFYPPEPRIRDMLSNYRKD